MSEPRDRDGLPQNTSDPKDTTSNTGDEQSSGPQKQVTEEDMAGQGLGQFDNDDDDSRRVNQTSKGGHQTKS